MPTLAGVGFGKIKVLNKGAHDWIFTKKEYRFTQLNVN